jgi:hypothetical protein
VYKTFWGFIDGNIYITKKRAVNDLCTYEKIVIGHAIKDERSAAHRIHHEKVFVIRMMNLPLLFSFIGIAR